jgi:hypothetical protein
MKTRTGVFALRLPLSLKAAMDRVCAKDGYSVNQFNVAAVAEKFSVMEGERFFAERQARADDAAFLRILNREGGAPPRPNDVIDDELRKLLNERLETLINL